MKRMIVVVMFCGWLSGGALAGDEKDPRAKLPEPLSKALKEISGADSYSLQTVPDGRKEEGVEGKYVKGLPENFKTGGMEFYRMGEKLVYKENDQWQKTRTGTLSDPLRILGPSARVRQAVLPHQQLAGVGKFLKEIKSASGEDKGGSVLTAKLTLEGCRALLLPADSFLAKEGTIEFGLDKDGHLAFYEFKIAIEGVRGNADVSGTVTLRVTLGELGKAKLEAPEAVLKLLEVTTKPASDATSKP